MNMLNDYTKEFLAIKTELEEMELDERVMQDTLEPFKDAIAEEADNLASMIEELVAIAKMQKDKAKALTEKAKVNENKAEFIKKFIDEAMKAQDIKALKTENWHIKYNKGREVVQIDEKKLPPEYWIPQDPKPMGKPELKKLLDAGKEIDGVCKVRNPDTLQMKLL